MRVKVRSSDMVWFAVMVVLMGFVWYMANRRNAADDRAAVLATDLLIERARSDSLEVAVAEDVRTFEEMLTENDALSEAMQGLGEELSAVQAEKATLIRVVAEAKGHAEATEVRLREALADSTQPAEGEGVEMAAGTLEATFSEEGLEAQLECSLTDPPTCSLDWRAWISGHLVQAQAPDGRTVIFAEADSPNSELRIPEFYVSQDREGLSTTMKVVAGVSSVVLIVGGLILVVN